jgi:hypothetical protein
MSFSGSASLQDGGQRRPAISTPSGYSTLLPSTGPASQLHGATGRAAHRAPHPHILQTAPPAAARARPAASPIPKQFSTAAHEAFESVVRSQMLTPQELAAAQLIQGVIEEALNEVLQGRGSIRVLMWGSASDGTAVRGISDVDFVVVNSQNQELTRQERQEAIQAITAKLRQRNLVVTPQGLPTATKFVCQLPSGAQFPISFDVVIKHTAFKQGKVVRLQAVQMPGRPSTRTAVAALKLLLRKGHGPAMHGYAWKAIVWRAFDSACERGNKEGIRALDVFAEALWMLHNMSCASVNRAVVAKVSYLKPGHRVIDQGEMEFLANLARSFYAPLQLQAAAGSQASRESLVAFFAQRLH